MALEPISFIQQPDGSFKDASGSSVAGALARHFPIASEHVPESVKAASKVGLVFANVKAQQDTHAEANELANAPRTSNHKTFAQERFEFMRKREGLPLVPFEFEGETFYARRFSYGVQLYLALLMPLTPQGYLDPSNPYAVAHLLAETLYAGLCRDAIGTPYFDNKADAAAYVDHSATNEFAAVAITKIDEANNLFPKAPQPTEAQKRRERVKTVRAQGDLKKPAHKAIVPAEIAARVEVQKEANGQSARVKALETIPTEQDDVKR